MTARLYDGWQVNTVTRWPSSPSRPATIPQDAGIRRGVGGEVAVDQDDVSSHRCWSSSFCMEGSRPAGRRPRLVEPLGVVRVVVVDLGHLDLALVEVLAVVEVARVDCDPEVVTLVLGAGELLAGGQGLVAASPRAGCR